MPERSYVSPASLADALVVLRDGPRTILAGGTDVYPALGSASLTAPILDLTRVPGLAGVSVDVDAVRIGAATTWSQIARADLPKRCHALQQAAREIGARQIQNRGTIGGNLCNASPAADGVPPLLALGAEVALAGAEGSRKMRLEEFILGVRRTALRPGEILTGLTIPMAPEPAVSAFRKLGSRSYLVISIVMAAAALNLDRNHRVAQARVAVAACSPAARRLPMLEDLLVGAHAAPGLGACVRAEHMGALSPIDDVRATAAYRREAALILVREVIEDCIAEASR